MSREGQQKFLVIDERISSADVETKTSLSIDEGRLIFHVGDEIEAEIPTSILEAVMRRYAKPLADDITLAGERLELPGGRSLVLLRHLGRYDVIAKDYLVYASPPDPPIAELATSIAGALTYLARARKGF